MNISLKSLYDFAHILCAGLLAGCGDDGAASPHIDAGDAAVHDAGATDSGPPDGGAIVDSCDGAYARWRRFDLACEISGIAEGPDALLLPVDFMATVATQPTAGDSFEACVETTTTIGRNIADLFLAVGAASGVTSVTLDEFTAGGAIAGATPAAFLLEGGVLPRAIEFDANGDNVGEAVDLDFGGNRLIVTSDGSPTVKFSLSSLHVTLADIPQISKLAINVPSQMGDMTTSTFPADASTSTIVLDML